MFGFSTRAGTQLFYKLHVNAVCGRRCSMVIVVDGGHVRVVFIFCSSDARETSFVSQRLAPMA